MGIAERRKLLVRHADRWEFFGDHDGDEIETLFDLKNRCLCYFNFASSAPGSMLAIVSASAIARSFARVLEVETRAVNRSLGVEWSLKVELERQRAAVGWAGKIRSGQSGGPTHREAQTFCGGARCAGSRIVVHCAPPHPKACLGGTPTLFLERAETA